MKPTKLELKHLAAYLPYELSGIIKANNSEMNKKIKLDLRTCAVLFDFDSKFNFKPILRPLSDVTKEIEINGEKFVPIEVLANIAIEKLPKAMYERAKKDILEYIKSGNLLMLPYKIIEKLISWHFNVFNLPENLFINYSDINNLKPE
jgi:hypothetical protein